MLYRTDIEKALDGLVADEAGPKFQGLAVVLAKQKWPRLVASERKWDLGLDAYATGAMEPDGNGFGLACSLTPEYEKLAADATKVKKNFPDVRVLAFATAGKVSNYRAKHWAKELRKDFDLGLIVLSREELVTSLIEPANVDICRSQLGLHVEVSPAIAPVAERAREAVKEVVETWSLRPRLAGRPQIDLDAERVEEERASNERLSVESLRASLVQGRRIILEAPAGRGKTTTLVQIAKRTVDAGGLPFLVDLPSWVRSGTEILQFVAQAPAFAGRGLDVNALLNLRGIEPFFFLLNGWNEISEGTAESAVHALRELERNYPKAGIIVATRTHRLRPPLPGAFRAKLLTLRRAQRDEYLAMALGKSANELRVKLNNSRTLDELTRTPLILAEVTELFHKGKPIPPTKMGILAAVIEMIEDSEEHHVFLQEAPLRGHAGEYLGALSMAMTEKGDVEIGEADARAVVTSVSLILQKEGQLATLPEPTNVLNELSKRHVLERLIYPGTAFRFQHQQFQEFFAARGLKGCLLEVVRRGDAAEDRKFAKQYVNEPKWGESLRMLAEDIAASTDGENPKKELVEAGSKLIRMALHVDPMFAADLAHASGPTVWLEVRGDIGKRLRAWFAQEDGNHRQCALTAMLATGSDDFQDILVPLLTDANDQVRLAVYHGGAELLPSSLGPNWQDVVRSWPEAARLDFLLELARDPWLADTVEAFALADPSPRVRWNVAHMLSWFGFTEKVEALLAPLDDESLRESLRASHREEIPASLWSRVVGLHERTYTETSDPLERLRLLHILQGFGGGKIAERLKAELDGLGPEGLKSENLARVKWALEELQKSDAKWVSEWVARKVLNKSTWFGGWQGLITQIPDEERDSLYARFSTDVLDQGEQQRVMLVFGATADASLAARVFKRACEIRRGLSLVPGQDQPKWNLFRQQVDLLKAIGPQKMLDGVLDKLDQKPDVVELEMLTDGLPAMNPVRADTRSSVSEETRLKLRAYLKKGAELGADPDGLRANTRAHLALLLANVGEREDLADIRRLIEADTVRFQAAQEARKKGDRSHDEMGYGLLYFDAVTTVDPVAADDVLVELVRQGGYEWVLAQRLPLLARKSAGQPGFGTSSLDFGKIWKSRAGEPDDSFVEERRSRYAVAILGAVERIKKEREGATDKRGFDYRLKILGGALASLDGKRSAKLVLELIELPGRWDGWTRVGALESLLVWGVRLSLEEVLRILDPVIQELRASGIYSDNQNAWLFARCLSVMAFVEQAEAGVAKIRELLSDLRFRPHEMGTAVAALGASRCDDATELLIELAGADGKGVEAIREPWIEAIRALGGKRADQALLSFVDPNAKLFTTEFIPDYRHGDLLARLLAERAAESGELKAELVRLANGDLPPAKRLLLAKVFGRSRTEEDLVEGLCVLRDDGSGVPYELVRSIEDVFLERRAYGASGNAYTLSPLGCNAVRKRLFEMAIGDPNRKRSAFALIGQIEVWRLEHGRPPDEPRHPAIESGVPWPPLFS
jgi:NACHT conflict system protein